MSDKLQFVDSSLDIFPEGDPSSGPGLLYSATLGKMASEFPNPNGVAALMINDETWRGSIAATAGRNPFRVAINTDTDTVPTRLPHPG